MATVQGKDGDGNTVTLNVDLSHGLEISTIDSELEWTLTTIDNSPHTEVTPYIGSRPDDR